jgi:hypothetical protein
LGGKTATTTQSVAIPPEVLARYNAVNARAERVAEQPFQQYGGQFVAGLTPTQQAGIGAIQQAAGAAQPYYGAAAGFTAAGAGQARPGELETQRYMNPFTQNVVDATRRGLEQQQGMQLAEQQAAAIRGGAFGGDRAGIQRAVLQGQQGLATAQAISPLYQRGYEQAVQTAQQQQGVGLQAEQANLQRQLAAGAQFGQLGSGAQQAGLAGAQALLGAGTLEQQTQQADLTARYQQFLQERGYPFQVAQFLANIAMGTGALSGSTTTTTQPQPFFSDEREKTNIKPLGKGLYAYDYIDDVERARETGEPMPPKRVGPMAQDIEARRPGLVVDINDYKVVDPSRDSMGGAVMHPGHYAPGGLVAPEDMRAILASQQQFLGPYAGSGGPYGGKPGYVPQTSLHVPKLMTAGPAPAQRPSEFQQLAGGIQQTAGLGESLLGEKGLFGEKGLGSKVMSGARSVGEKVGISSPPPAPAPAPTPSTDTGLAAGSRQTDDQETVREARHGGLVPHSYAMGGMPYGGDPTLQGVLEEGEQQVRQLPKPGEPPKTPGGLGSDLKDAASLIGAGSTLYSAGSAAASALPALLAFLPFSDARLKRNIDPVGETYDGQQIYRYDMGDGRTQLGLMAQEVMRRKPDAVGERNGFLTLDYDRATEDAVPRAYGGLVPRQGYADGGEMPSDDELAVRTMLSEAGRGRRGEINPQEALGIAAVIANRAKSRGLSPGDVVLQQGQFEPWAKPGGPNDPMKWDVSSPEYRQMAEYWARAKAGEDPTGGASHFWGPRSQYALGRSAPAWAGTGGPRFGGTQFERVENIPMSAAIPTQRAPGSDIPAEGSQEVQLQRPAEGGLTGFAKSVLPTTKSPSGEESINWKQTLIPILSGLGAMASSPSRYLGSAILQGLGAGAQSYANLEKQQADVAQTQEMTRTQQAETARRWLAAAKDAIFNIQGRAHVLTAKGPVLWNNYAADPTRYGEPIAGAQARRAIEQIPGATPITPDVYGEAGGAPGTPSAPGTPGAPAAPGAPGTEKAPGQPQHITTQSPTYVTGAPTPYTLVGRSAPQNIEIDKQRALTADPPIRQANLLKTQQGMATVQTEAENATKLAARFDKLAEYALSLPKSGWTEQGPLNQLKSLWLGYANDVLRTAGSPVRINEAEIGTGEAMRKLQNAMSGQAGSRSDQALQTAMGSIPNIGQSRDGFIKSYVPERIRIQRDMDKARYVEDYRRSYEQKYGRSFPDGWSIDNAIRSFNDDNPETQYDMDAARMKWLMNTDDRRTGKSYWSAFKSNAYPHYYSDKMTGGVGYRRYFEGFRQ